MIDSNEPEELSEIQLMEYKHLLTLLILQAKKKYIWTKLAIGICSVVGLLSIGYGVYLRYFSIGATQTTVFLQYIVGLANIYFAFSGVVGFEKIKAAVVVLETELKSLEEKTI